MPLVAAQPSDLSQALKEVCTQSAGRLYPVVWETIDAYYGSDLKADDSRQNGWYRVHDFLKWVKKDENKLLKEKVNFSIEDATGYSKSVNTVQELLLSKKLGHQQILWTYLGARYFLSRLHLYNLNSEQLFFELCNNNSCARPANKRAVIQIQRGMGNNILYLNVGIHEVSHVLLSLTEAGSRETLSEFASFYAQYNYALPVEKNLMMITKHGLLKNIGGVRDFLTIFLRNSYSELENEYFAFVVGPLLNKKQLTEKTLFSLTGGGGGESLYEVSKEFLLARENKMFEVTCGACDMLVTAEEVKDLGKKLGQSDAIIAKSLSLKPLYCGDGGAVSFNEIVEIYKKTGKQDDIMEDLNRALPKGFSKDQKYFRLSLQATKKGTFFLKVTKPVSPQQILKKHIHAPDNVYVVVQDFFELLGKNIPWDLATSLRYSDPIMGYCLMDEWNDKQRQALVKTAVETLQSMGASPAPIPPGYL